MKNGGARPGAGRKPGSLASHTLQAQEYRKILVAEILKNAEPLAKALVKEGLKGNIPALKEINERSIGKVREEVDITSGGKPIVIPGDVLNKHGQPDPGAK